MDMKVGNMVFIKNEGSKVKARDRYIIVKIEGVYAILQKFGDKFMSRQYKVPVSNIYQAPSCSSHMPHHDWDNSHTGLNDTTSDEDDGSILEDDDDGVSPEPEAPGNEDPQAPVQQRPQRQRQAPAWQRSGEYEL